MFVCSFVQAGGGSVAAVDCAAGRPGSRSGPRPGDHGPAGQAAVGRPALHGRRVPQHRPGDGHANPHGGGEAGSGGVAGGQSWGWANSHVPPNRLMRAILF